MDLRRVFLVYLEGPNSILVKNQKENDYIKFIDFPLVPLFGVPWAAVICMPVVCLFPCLKLLMEAHAGEHFHPRGPDGSIEEVIPKRYVACAQKSTS